MLVTSTHTQVTIHNLEDVLGIIRTGEKQKRVFATAMNDRRSWRVSDWAIGLRGKESDLGAGSQTGLLDFEVRSQTGLLDWTVRSKTLARSSISCEAIL
jgi:hypothetical protein